MNRRAAAFKLLQETLAMALCGSASITLAQGVAQPIRRPRSGFPDLSLRPGRLDPGGVNYGSAPGLFTVVSISARENTVRLRDAEGRSADIYVSERLLDVETLNAGDVVVVDFFVGGDNDDRLEAALIEKLESAPR